MKIFAFLFLFGNSWFAHSHTTKLPATGLRPADPVKAAVTQSTPAAANKRQALAILSTTTKAPNLAGQTKVISTQAVDSPKDTIIIKLKNRNKMMLITTNGDLSSFVNVDLATVVGKLDSSRNDGGTFRTNDSTIKMKSRTYRVAGSSSIKFIEVNRPNWDRHSLDSIMHDAKVWGRSTNRKRTTGQLDIDFGLNLYTANGAQVDSREPYTLDNLNSRYFALRFLSKTRLGASSSPHHLQYGLELSWYNFKFGKKLRIEQDGTTGDLSWNPAPQGQNNYDDSKLTVAYLNAPLMYYYQRSRGLRFGFGGYAGYKLDEYSKVSQDNKTIRAGEGDFNINNVQLGLRGQVGWGGIDVFCNYNLTTLFKADRGPSLTPIAFGISF